MRGRSPLVALAVTCALASGASAQTAPQEAIDAAADAHAVFQKKGGLAAVKKGISECWENAAKQASFKAAVYCSAYNFTAANFDAGFMKLLNAKPSLSMADANRQSKAALIRAGVPSVQVPALMDDIRERVISATNQRF
ncbi:hypothetical protein [Methylorubrum sp. POS3]|uniref:hypothetical protein n=1 Tax=Methylorubrum sp. POS3 TaxID=2998492 RepID=UPI00372BF253